MAHTGEQLVDEFSRTASISDFKIKLLAGMELGGGLFHLCSVC